MIYLEYKSLVQRTLGQRYTCITERGEENKDYGAPKTRSSRPELFYKKGVLQNFVKLSPATEAGACNFIKKETLAEVFFCEFCEIFKSIFFYRTPPWLLLKNYFAHVRTLK